MLILAALLAYESILTIEDEVNLIWRRKLSIASALFIMNRIAASLIVVSIILFDVDNVRRAFRVDHYHLMALFRCEFFRISGLPGLDICIAAVPELWACMWWRSLRL